MKGKLENQLRSCAPYELVMKQNNMLTNQTLPQLVA